MSRFADMLREAYWQQIANRLVVNEADGSVLVYVPAGEFEMGDGQDANCPEHRVYVDAYYIGIYCVTNAQYARDQPEGHSPPRTGVVIKGSTMCFRQGSDAAKMASRVSCLNCIRSLTCKSSIIVCTSCLETTSSVHKARKISGSRIQGTFNWRQ